ncbi:MAG: methyltransferase domain-containing protein [Planctomycetota bacterium]
MTHDPNLTLQRFYRWNAPIYDLTRWTILRGRQAAIEALRLRPGERVLEIGCGTGLNLARLRQQVGARGLVVGLDHSYAMLARARRRRLPHVCLVQADAARLAFRGRFHAVLMAYSLRMIPDWNGALERACAHLEPDGTLVVLDFAPRTEPLAFWRALLDRHLAWNHVDTGRDLKGALQQCMEQVEELDAVPAYVTLLRGTGLRMPSEL